MNLGNIVIVTIGKTVMSFMFKEIENIYFLLENTFILKINRKF